MDTDAQQLVYISMTSLPVFKDQVTLTCAAAAGAGGRCDGRAPRSSLQTNPQARPRDPKWPTSGRPVFFNGFNPV